MSLLEGLNAAQKSAVASKASILQVLAPPGSGKTKTLTSRVAWLLQNGCAPQNLICCTFTIKAAREMRERLRGLVGGDVESKVILGTFHSICRRYLVAYGKLINIPPNFGIADSGDSLSIIKRLTKKMEFKMDPKTARSKISGRKARGETLADIQNKPQKKSIDTQEFISIFQEYESALATSNLLDYDDLLLKCVELFQKYPGCVGNVQALLIDEFQDTNIVQFELMKLLASSQNKITIVGDPDQSIYGFRAAEIANLKRMRDYYPDTNVINLELNYRSSSAVLKLAQAVIDQDELRPDKKLKSTHEYGTLPVLRKVHNPYEEAAWIVSEIKRLTKMTAKMIDYSDIAILLRSAFLSRLIEQKLGKEGIPYKMVGGNRFFDRAEVRIILDYMRTINHPDNNAALVSIINTPSRKIGDTTVQGFLKLADEQKISLWALIQKVAEGKVNLARKLTKPAEIKLKDFVAIIKRGKEKVQGFEAAQSPKKLMDFIVSSIKFQEYLKYEYENEWEERWENVQELAAQAQEVTMEQLKAEDPLPEIDSFEQAQVSGPEETLSRFLANVALSTELTADDEGNETSRLTISTIHSAKGLEWPVVFIPAIYEGSIPHSRAEDTYEERRLLYVAMTRAKALLYMSFPMQQSRDQQESESVLTQFLPTELEPFMRTYGPKFDDRVIKDIASILGRSVPSQEALAHAITSLGEDESAEDKVWPEDGSRRPDYFTNNHYHGGPEGQGGSTITTALGGQILRQQSFEATSISGFMTASHHLNTNPARQEVANPVPTKLAKAKSAQGNLSTYFGTGSFKPAEKENRAPMPISNPATSRGLSTYSKQPVIPSDLANHKLGRTIMPGPGFKRSRSALAEIESSNAKRPYTYFSSDDLDQTKQTLSTNPPPPTTTTSITTYSTMMSTLQNGSTFSGSTTYRSGMLNTLNKPVSLSGSMNQNNGMRRTLGVKRSMNGWAERKNK